MTGPRRIPLHQALVGTITLGGADRRLIVPVYLAGIILVVAAPLHPLTISIAVIGVAGGHWALVRAHKADPDWFAIYLRSLHYRQDVYPPHGHVRARPAKITPTLPR
jgi:type IV secretory pathway TrbD component